MVKFITYRLNKYIQLWYLFKLIIYHNLKTTKVELNKQCNLTFLKGEFTKMINRHVKAFFLLSVTLILLVGVATISAADTDGNSTVSDVSTQTDVPTQADVSTSTVVDEVDSDNNYENVNTEELNEKDAPSNKLQANSNPSGTYKVQITGMEMKSGKLVLNSTVTKNNIPISGGRVSYSVGNKWVGSPGPRYGNATLTTNNPGAGTYTIKATYIDVFDVQQANTTASLTINTTDVVINSYTFSNGNLTIKFLNQWKNY